ncbi:transient receptor potential cation channel subfamily A member 1-like isoform X2 [Ruditapes philippinarum]|nr:transient receptor potential cation channel subfamily A member 1-like isoform X2 [Ruditapes philippinarum]
MEMVRRRRLGAAPDAAGEDGDFVQLRLVRERRKKERQATGKPAEEFTNDNGAVRAETALVYKNEPKSRPSTAVRIRAAQDLREEMFKAVDSSDKHQLQTLFQKVGKFGRVSEIRDPITDENVLHYALSRDKKDIVTFLIALEDVDLLISYHGVQRSGMHGRNNALHTLTERHDTEMAKFLLAKMPSKEKRLELMKLETAVDIQGQRPRLFSCLHLAAYYGHTDLVALYLDQGMDVNHLNGKKDTPLLWAARWGHDETVNLLLDRHADPEVNNDKSSTALYWAIRYEFPKTVSLLLNKGKANPNTKRKLGLIAPIVIAAAYGNVEIMSLLLQHPDINMNVTVPGGETPMHHAAKEGCPAIIEMLIKRGALFDEQDEIGDTPLLLAAKSGHVDIVQELIRKGANVKHRNHEGHDAWYFAMENEDNALLETLVIATRDHEISWRQPLCIAANSGRCDKFQFLLKMNIDPMKADADGNTFLHHAAMSNQSEIIDKFHEIISLNTQNNRGNTPLHIACFRGNTKTIESLIACKAKADVKNKKGETALHVAAYSKHITAEIVRKLVDYTIKTHAWESLNAKDFEGNNALHIAGKFARPEVLWEFRFVPFKDKDKDGLLPLHEAVRPGQPEALEIMLDIFESMQRDARINEQSRKNSETVLHLAADEGHASAVKRLISLGADVAMKDINGNTVLHRLTKHCANDTRYVTRHLEVIDTILENVVKWWCIRNNVPFPEEENQDVLMNHRREAILFLINDIINNEGLSVLDQAFKSGVPEVLSKLLMLDGVTMFERPDKHGFNFDITSLTPKSNDSMQGCCSGGRVSPLSEKDIISKTHNTEFEGISGIEWLINYTDKARAAEILDLPPIRLIEQYYRSMVTWTFAALMFFHIIYMSIFTYVGVDLLKKLRKDESAINSSDSETVLMYIVVPIEPAIILIYVLYTLIRYCITGDLGRKSRMSRKEGIRQVVSIIASYLFFAVCIVFALLVFAWIGLFTERYKYQDYFLSAALCIGWLLTISFTRGIRAIHYFYRMLISMIFRDVSRFMIVYLFVILAFGFAFHVLFQISTAISDDYPHPGDTLFLTFNMMIGMGELFDDNFETNMAAAGRTTVYSKVLYLVYIILGTIVLLNLLIAMMNDSYSMILKENQITWRIESVSLGVDIESSFPASQLFSRVKITRGELGPKATNIPSERWYVSMHETLFDQFMRESDRKYSTSTDAVTKRLEDIDTRVAEVERQTNDKLQHISNLLEQIRDRNKPVKETDR